MSRCPFLNRTSVNQIKQCSDNLLESFAKKCPVASKEICTRTGAKCPFVGENRKLEKELKIIASKCHDWTCQGNVKGMKVPLKIEAEIALGKKIENKTYRVWATVRRNADGTESEVNKERVINWTSNDYLGLSNHPEVTNAAVSEIHLSGVGSGGSRNISGTHEHHNLLENELASWHGHEAGLLFTSCYTANDSVLSQMGTLAKQNGRKLVFISDAKNHSSMIEGIRKAEKLNVGYVEKQIFNHNDTDHLEQILSSYDETVIKCIVFESVYSMEGDHAPIDVISALARTYGALTFCDEVHAVGLYGQQGQGLVEKHHGVDIITGTLGKALGSMGGYVTSSRTFVEYFRLHCPGLIYTTSLPPGITAAARKSLEISCSEEGSRLRIQHKLNVENVKTLLLDYFPELEEIFETSGHVIPVYLEGSQYVKDVQKEMQKCGHYCQAVFAPTVPVGEERLRLVVTPHHSVVQMEKLVEDLAKVCGRKKRPDKFFQMF